MSDFRVIKTDKEFVCSCKRVVRKDCFIMEYKGELYCSFCALRTIRVFCLNTEPIFYKRGVLDND